MSNVVLTLGESMRPLYEPAIAPTLGRIVMVESSRGTGKTFAILSIIIARALRFPRTSWLIARSTKSRLADTVMKTLDEKVLPAFGLPVPMDSREHRKVYRLPNGSELVFQGLQDEQRSQSAEVAGVYVAEAVELESKDQVTSLVGAMRGVTCPTFDYYQMIVDCNPGSPGHWLNKACEPAGDVFRRIVTREDHARSVARNFSPPVQGWKRIVTSYCDNPGYWDSVKWGFTPAGQTYMDGLAYLTGHLRDRWLYGLWRAAEGNVYAEFDESRHVIDPFEVPADWPWWVGFDPGKDHPMALLWFTRGPAGTLYIADEVYGSGYEVRDVCRFIGERSKGRRIQRIYGDPQMVTSNTMYAEKSISEQMREFGVSIAPWPRTGRNSAAMVEAVRTLLTAQPEPALKVFRGCQSTINEFQSWRYKRTASGELPNGDDQFEDKDNHAMDVTRGMVAAGIARVGVGVRAYEGEEQRRGVMMLPSE
jgi:PBSX family phage terminase large subunit